MSGGAPAWKGLPPWQLFPRAPSHAADGQLHFHMGFPEPLSGKEAAQESPGPGVGPGCGQVSPGPWAAGLSSPRRGLACPGDALESLQVPAAQGGPSPQGGQDSALIHTLVLRRGTVGWWRRQGPWLDPQSHSTWCSWGSGAGRPGQEGQGLGLGVDWGKAWKGGETRFCQPMGRGDAWGPCRRGLLAWPELERTAPGGGPGSLDGPTPRACTTGLPWALLEHPQV